MLLDTVFGWFSEDMGIDLGTCTTLVCVRNEGIVLNEPSVVAVRKGTNTVLNNGEAVGLVAREMLGKTPGSITAIRPLKDGVISDFEITEKMLGYFIRKVHGRGLVRPRVVIAVPSGITAVERRAVIDSAERAGARKVYLVDEPMAAGIGAALPITEPTASMIVDIGGGTSEVAIMSLADISTCESIRIGGDDFDEALINHLKRTYNLLVGEPRAEQVKIQIGSAVPLEQELTMEIAGRDTISGLPRKIVITSEEIREALREPIAAIIETVMRTLEKAEPELAADLIENGMHLCGGGSLLRGMDSILSNATGLKVVHVEDPISCVARGTSVYLENLDLWKDTMDQTGYSWD
ncbi:MAG TPA: rod shape-determining protein [Planctomycetes bacterium]|nr:rod shape-determining protein [Planctomycetota bacterium]HIJ70162.1 rod shape-determining protein [Planctomycetota bacterium]